MAEGPYSVLGRVNYPCTILLFNVYFHVGRFPGFVVLHHLRLQEERDEGGGGQESYISYLLEGGEGQVQEVVQHGTPVVQSNVK